MGPQRVPVALMVVGLLRDPAFHVAKCAAEVTPGLQPQRWVGSSGERCGLEVNKQGNACTRQWLLGGKYSDFQVSALLWCCQAQASSFYGLRADQGRGGVSTAASSPPCSYTSKKFYGCVMLYKISGTPKLCPACSAAYGKSLNVALLVQMRKQKAASLTGCRGLFTRSSAVRWMGSTQPIVGWHKADLHAPPAPKSLSASLVSQHCLQLMKLCSSLISSPKDKPS